MGNSVCNIVNRGNLWEIVGINGKKWQYGVICGNKWVGILAREVVLFFLKFAKKLFRNGFL